MCPLIGHGQKPMEIHTEIRLLFKGNELIVQRRVLVYKSKYKIYMYEDDLQLGELKKNCLLLKLSSQTQTNASKPQTRI